MMRFLFKQQQPKRFEFKPRYYNERKERLDARVEAIKREMEVENSEYTDLELRSRMQTSWRRQDMKKSKQTSNKNVLIIAALLVVIAYLLLR